MIAKPNELQFDLDSGSDYLTFKRFLHTKLEPHWPKASVKEWRSQSGNRHAVVTLPVELSVEERIALQAMGGSDLGREFAALMCHKAGSPHPVLLFRPKGKESI